MFFTGKRRIRKSQSGCHHAGLSLFLLLLLLPSAASCKLALFPPFCLHGCLPLLLLWRPAVSFPFSACTSQVILTHIRLRALFIYSIYVNWYWFSVAMRLNCCTLVFISSCFSNMLKKTRKKKLLADLQAQGWKCSYRQVYQVSWVKYIFLLVESMDLANKQCKRWLFFVFARMKWFTSKGQPSM